MQPTIEHAHGSLSICFQPSPATVKTFTSARLHANERYLRSTCVVYRASAGTFSNKPTEVTSVPPSGPMTFKLPQRGGRE
jgi:hypothetical protein